MRTARHLQVVTSDAQPRENTCHHHVRELLRLSEADLTEIEDVFLQVFRHLCESLSSETEFGRTAAHELADRELGERNGLDLIGLTEDLLDAIGTERCGNFAFMPTECPVCSRYLSEEEWITLDLLRAAQRSDDAALANHADLMTAGGPARNTTIAALALGRFFGRMAKRPIQSDQVRPMRTASSPQRNHD